MSEEKEIKEEKSVIERIFDENDDENIILYDENNNPVEFEQLAVIPRDNDIYVVVHRLDEDNIRVLSIETIDGEDYLVGVEDQDILDMVEEDFNELYKEYEEKNADKADDEE